MGKQKERGSGLEGSLGKGGVGRRGMSFAAQGLSREIERNLNLKISRLHEA